MWDRLFAGADMLQKGMSAAWTRNAVIRDNIANVETPGFKASDVEFESIFAKAVEAGGGTALKQTREKHRQIGSPGAADAAPVITRRTGTAMRADGNNVDIEVENVKLAQNGIYYKLLTEKLNSELARIKMAIEG